MIPRLGLGTWGLRADAETLVSEALGLGYRMVDTASGYVNEREVGAGIIRSRIPRQQVTICTKFPVELFGKEREVLRFSLESLQTDYIDVWLVHGPMPGRELLLTWSRMREAKDSGAVRHIGVSNFSIEQLEWLHRKSGVYPEINQAFFPADDYLPDLVDAHRARGVEPMAHSPFHRLNMGLATNSRSHEDILLSYLDADVAVVFGSRSVRHLTANLSVLRHHMLNR